MTAPRSRARGIGLSLAAAAAFGIFAPAARESTNAVPALLAAGLTYGTAAAFAAAVRVGRAVAGGRPWGRRPGPADAARVGLMTLLGGIVAPALFFEGASRLRTPEIAILQHAEFALTVLAAVVFLGERHPRRAWMGVLAIGAGVTTLSWSPGAVSVAAIPTAGLSFVVAACAAWAADNLLARGVSGVDPLITVMLKGALAGIALVAISGSEGLARVPPSAWLWIALGGGLGVGGSLVLELLALRHVSVATNAALFATGPALGVAWGAVLLRDAPSVRAVAALALCLLGVGLLSFGRGNAAD